MTAKIHEASWRDAPGWDAVESGLDLAFRAIAVRLVLMLLGGVAVMAPIAEGTTQLFGGVAIVLLAVELLATGALVQALRRVGRGPADGVGAGARPLAAAALGTAVAALAAEALLLVHHTAGVFAAERATAALGFIGDLLWLMALALLLAAASRLAAAARASLGRSLAAGQLALVLLTGSYALLQLTGRLADPVDGPTWAMMLGAFAVPVAVFVLYPLHRLARRLRLASDPPTPEEDFDLDAPFPVLELALFRRRRASAGAISEPEADDPDAEGAPWVPRHERLARLHLAGAPVQPPPDQHAWETARAGLQLAFGGVAGRVAALLFAFVVPPSALGGGTLSHVVAVVLTTVLAYCSWALARGLYASRAAPRTGTGPSAARLTTAAALLAAALLAVDVTALALALLALVSGDPQPLAHELALASGVLALLIVLTLALALDALGRVLRERLLPRRARVLLLSLPLLASALLAMELLGRSDSSEVRAIAVVVTIAAFALTVTVGVTLMHLLHDGGETIDDHLARARRDAEASSSVAVG